MYLYQIVEDVKNNMCLVGGLYSVVASEAIFLQWALKHVKEARPCTNAFINSKVLFKIGIFKPNL